MADTDEDKVTLSKRLELIQAIPSFSNLIQTQSEELAGLMQSVSFEPNDQIVVENATIDSIYIIVDGEAEVTQEIKRYYKKVHIPIAILSSGDTIGLSAIGFYSATGMRTATVTALSKMVTLRLLLQDLQSFLKKNNLESSFYTATTYMLRMQLIKQSLPFTKLSSSRLQWLASQVKEETFSSFENVFKQGDVGDKCYLIRSGQIEIITTDQAGVEKRIALLKAPALFGEATLLTHATRNATARVVETTELLSLDYKLLLELLESEKNVAQVFMNMMVDRSRPIQCAGITKHVTTTVSGDEVTILKNENRKSYFKLSKEGVCIWDQLDGQHTLEEITFTLADTYHVFAPDMVVTLISKLTRAGFIVNLDMNQYDETKRSLITRVFIKIRQAAEVRFAIGHIDPWLSRVHQKYIHYLFTKPAQIIFVFIVMLGMFAFAFNTADVLLFFSIKHASLLLLLGLIPLSLIAVVLHELGHAFAVKAFGFEVHYMGVGWHWMMPIAFTDTSDMWLATRRPRLIVNLAGVYVDVLVAGLSALGMFLTDNPYLQCMLWLFSLYTYISAFRMLNPLQELDGYYVLMDWVEKPRLREAAVRWLLTIFPKTIRHPSLYGQYKAEVIYWLACCLFIIFTSLITLIVQEFILEIFGLEISNLSIRLILPIIIAMISTVGVIAHIRKAEKEL